MADPVTLTAISLGTSLIGGVAGAAGAETTAAGKQTEIQGQMLATIGKAFGFEVEAKQYGYQAGVATYQAGVAEMNRRISLQNAAYARDTGEITADIQGMKTRAELGMTVAAQGASGIDVGSGSSTAVRESMIQVGRYDQAVIRANAAKVAYGYEEEATQNAAQRDLYTYAASEDLTQAKDSLTAAGMTMQAIPLQQRAQSIAGTAGDIGAVSSIVGASGSVADKWLQAKTLGI